MNGLDFLMLGILGAGLFLAGRQVGHSQGFRDREIRVERQRADEIRKLLEFIKLVWR